MKTCQKCTNILLSDIRKINSIFKSQYFLLHSASHGWSLPRFNPTCLTQIGQLIFDCTNILLSQVLIPHSFDKWPLDALKQYTVEIVVDVSASCKVAWFSQFYYNRWLKSRNLVWGWVNSNIFYRAIPRKLSTIFLSSNASSAMSKQTGLNAKISIWFPTALNWGQLSHYVMISYMTIRKWCNVQLKNVPWILMRNIIKNWMTYVIKITWEIFHDYVTQSHLFKIR